MNLYQSIWLFLIFYNVLKIDGTKNTTFVPTKEWQTIEKGQKIPAGLHVKLNLQTGEKKAKLIDVEEKNNTQVKFLSKIPDLQESESDGITKTISTTLEEALKNLSKSDEPLTQEGTKRIKARYRSYEEIKKTFKETNMNIKSDFEIINDLFQEFDNSSKYSKREKTLSRILEDLNYLSHQIDNALWFINKGGLNSIILPVLVNQTNVNLRIQSLRVLGALTQNNPKVKIQVFEQNFSSYLTQILINSTDVEELSAGLYAFGSLIRDFPHAQKEILAKSGLKALIVVLLKDVDIKIKLKTLILINDLLTEREDVLSNDSKTSSKYQQYQQVFLDKWLKEEGFCETFSNLLNSIQTQLISSVDILDHFIQSMEKTSKICLEIWSKNILMNKILQEIVENFNVHSTQTQDDYTSELISKLKHLNKIIYKNKTRDEL